MTPADDDCRALTRAAGVLPHEMHDDPDYGVLLSVTAVRKIATHLGKRAEGERIVMNGHAYHHGVEIGRTAGTA